MGLYVCTQWRQQRMVSIQSPIKRCVRTSLSSATGVLHRSNWWHRNWWITKQGWNPCWYTFFSLYLTSLLVLYCTVPITCADNLAANSIAFGVVPSQYPWWTCDSLSQNCMGDPSIFPVRASTPSDVMSNVCSNWAERFPSAVVAVHSSGHVRALAVNKECYKGMFGNLLEDKLDSTKQKHGYTFDGHQTVRTHLCLRKSLVQW